MIASLARMTKPQDPAPPLGEPVVSGIHNTPFDVIAEIRETTEHHREVAAALFGRRLEQPVNVLKKDKARSAKAP